MKVALRSLEERAIEWMTALAALWWGINLAMSGDMLSAPRFAAFHFLDEATWSALFLSLGMIRLVALWVNGRWPTTPYIRIVCAFASMILFGMVSKVLVDPHIVGWNGTWSTLQLALSAAGPAWGIYGLLSTFEVVTIYRAAYDSRYEPSRLRAHLPGALHVRH